jgi:hypothetical protein
VIHLFAAQADAAGQIHGLTSDPQGGRLGLGWQRPDRVLADGGKDRARVDIALFKFGPQFIP